MQLSLQPLTTAGIALVGASAIALSPLAPPPVTASATTAVSTAAVQLSAAVDPLTRWGQVIEASAANLNELADYYMERPFPIATEIVNNIQTYAGMVIAALPALGTNLQNWVNTMLVPGIQKSFEELLAGQPEQAAKSLASSLSLVAFQLLPAMNLLAIPNMIADHVYGVAKEIFYVPTMAPIVNLPIGLVNDVFISLGASAQDVLDAFNTGDALGGLTALANTPADLADRMLNKVGGLIEFRLWGGCGCIVAGGPVLNLLINLPRRIADRLVIPAAAGTTVAEPPAGFTLKAESEPAAISMSADPTSATDPAATGASGESAPTASTEPAPSNAGIDATVTEGHDTLPTVNVSSTEATDLSAGKAETEASATKTPSAQRVKTSLRNAADKVDERIKKLSTGIEKSVKKVSDNIAKAGKKKTAGGSASSASASDKAGTDSDD